MTERHQKHMPAFTKALSEWAESTGNPVEFCGHTGSIGFCVSFKMPNSDDQVDIAWATPFWDGEDGIPVQLCDNDGDYHYGCDIPYEFTFDAKVDVENYVAKMRAFFDGFGFQLK
jgi:hypothetical protein